MRTRLMCAPYRSRIYLEPYTPHDPNRLTEEDIVAVRESMPSRQKMKGKPPRAEDSGSEKDEAEKDVADVPSEGENSEGGKEERKSAKRKRKEKSSGKRKKQQNVADSDEEMA
jgi:hypothetical protein